MPESVSRTNLKRRHAIVVLLIVLVALAAILNWFPLIQNNSLIVAGSVLATAIELYGFVKDRKSKNESQTGSNANLTSSGPVGIQQQDVSIQGPQTNIADKVDGDVFSGKFDRLFAAYQSPRARQDTICVFTTTNTSLPPELTHLLHVHHL